MGSTSHINSRQVELPEHYWTDRFMEVYSWVTPEETQVIKQSKEDTRIVSQERLSDILDSK